MKILDNVKILGEVSCMDLTHGSKDRCGISDCSEFEWDCDDNYVDNVDGTTHIGGKGCCNQNNRKKMKRNVLIKVLMKRVILVYKRLFWICMGL